MEMLFMFASVSPLLFPSLSPPPLAPFFTLLSSALPPSLFFIPLSNLSPLALFPHFPLLSLFPSFPFPLFLDLSPSLFPSHEVGVCVCVGVSVCVCVCVFPLPSEEIAFNDGLWKITERNALTLTLSLSISFSLTLSQSPTSSLSLSLSPSHLSVSHLSLCLSDLNLHLHHLFLTCLFLSIVKLNFSSLRILLRISRGKKSMSV